MENEIAATGRGSNNINISATPVGRNVINDTIHARIIVRQKTQIIIVCACVFLNIIGCLLTVYLVSDIMQMSRQLDRLTVMTQQHTVIAEQRWNAINDRNEDKLEKAVADLKDYYKQTRGMP